MYYLARKPAAPLADFVDLLWLYEGYDVPHERERLLPDGTVELVINLAEDRIRVYDPHDPEKPSTIPGCVVSGPRSEFFIIDTAGEASTVGVHFKAGGAFPFFRVPPAEMINQSVALDCLWGDESTFLRERLLDATTPEERLRILEYCLLEQLLKPLERHPAVGFALQQICRPLPPPAMSQIRRSHRFQPATLYSALQRRSRIDAEVVFARHPLSEGHPHCPSFGRNQLDAGCARLRLLRSGALHPRLSIVCRHHAFGVPGPQDTARESRAHGLSSNFYKTIVGGRRHYLYTSPARYSAEPF